jgi:hypothetical protein
LKLVGDGRLEVRCGVMFYVSAMKSL